MSGGDSSRKTLFMFCAGPPAQSRWLLPQPAAQLPPAAVRLPEVLQAVVRQPAGCKIRGKVRKVGNGGTCCMRNPLHDAKPAASCCPCDRKPLVWRLLLDTHTCWPGPVPHLGSS